MTRQETIQTIEREKIVVITRNIYDEDLLKLAKALYEGGIRCFEITYDPEADFEYFTTSSEKHDGSICYEAECAHRCVLKILELKTYNKNIKIPEGYGNYKFKYTIGNIVVVNEYDEKFANTDKPWTNEKTTALLPIIFRCEVVD